MLTEGYKLDKGKLRFDLLPASLVYAVTWVLTWACTRAENPYPERNWERGMSWVRVFAGIMRHLWAWRTGETFDPESDKSHLWHAACGIAFLIDYEVNHPECDDRDHRENYTLKVTRVENNNSVVIGGGGQRRPIAVNAVDSPDLMEILKRHEDRYTPEG